MANFLTLEGTLVQGDAFTPQTTDQQGQPLLVKGGPNAGQPTQRFFIAVAFPKSDPRVLPWLIQTFRTEAVASWPRLFPAPNDVPPSFGCTHPNFSMKVMDGDGRDANGADNRSKPGFAGCWVVKFSSTFAPKVFNYGAYAAHEALTDPRTLYLGDTVRVAGTIEGNKNDQRPGLYVNLNMVEITRPCAPEARIQRGPDAAQVFGGSAPVPPAFAAPPPVPVAGGPAAYSPPAPPATPSPSEPYSGARLAASAGPVMLPKAAGATYESMIAAGWNDELLVREGMMAAPAPQPAAAPPPLPAAAPPPPPAAAPPPPPAAARVMLPKAGGASYESFIANGWTDALLVQNGMMAP